MKTRNSIRRCRKERGKYLYKKYGVGTPTKEETLRGEGTSRGTSRGSGTARGGMKKRKGGSPRVDKAVKDERKEKRSHRYQGKRRDQKIQGVKREKREREGNIMKENR